VINDNDVTFLVFRTAYETNENMFIGAPNGSGKLVCAEFALIRFFENNTNAKAVYCSPMDDLAQKVLLVYYCEINESYIFNSGVY
jgi:pre-mRNA-splicing helicase BRR2